MGFLRDLIRSDPAWQARQAQRSALAQPRLPRNSHSTCTTAGCTNRHLAKGLCSTCYTRARMADPDVRAATAQRRRERYHAVAEVGERRRRESRESYARARARRKT